jgi:PAS domain S-box-containing protein
MTARRMGRWLLGLCWLLAMAPAAAQGEFAIGTEDHYVLTRAFSYIVDEDGRLTLDDVLKPSVQATFQSIPQTGHGANFGFTSAAIWLRIRLRVAPTAPGDWLLELAYPPLDRVDLFAPGPGSSYRHQTGGDLLPFATRAIPHRNHVLRVDLVPGATSILYLRLKSEGTVVAPVTLWRAAALWQHDQAAYGLLSLYFGLLIGLLFYNLLLFLSVRDVGYLIYVAFVASMAVGQAALTGLGAQFVWADWTWLNNVLPAAGMSAAAIFGLMFTRHFLSSAVRMPRTDWFMRVQLAAWILTLIGTLVLTYTVATWLVTGLAMVSVATGVVVGVHSIYREFAGARLFFGAWFVLFLGALMLALHNAGLLPSNAFTANSLLIGSALEMVLLSFALADRINVARRFKEMAQARIAAEHAMVEALTQSQDQLREALREREAILNSMRVGIALSLRRRYEWVNQKLALMVGYLPDALIGQSARMLHPDAESWERFSAKSRAALLETGAYVGEHQLRRSSGEVFWVEISGNCLRPNDPDSGVIWTYLDISVPRRLEEAADLAPPVST